MRVVLKNRSPGLTIPDRRELRRLLDRLPTLVEGACACGLGDLAGDVQVITVSASAIAKLNARFLGHAGPTDVLTFDYREAGGSRGNAMDHAVPAEICICPEVARQASRRYGTTSARELLLYLVHGLLHVAGMDDQDPASRRRMRRAERKVLAQLEGRVALTRIFRLAACREA